LNWLTKIPNQSDILINLPVLFLTADKIFNGLEFLPDNSILVINNSSQTSDIVSAGSVSEDKVQKLNGIITPGFINAHCHTELSHLKNKVPEKTGLPMFGKEIILQRNNFPKEEIKEHIAEADKEMARNGIVAVGDISNNDDSFRMKESSSIHYHTFIEILALDPKKAITSFENGVDLLERLKSNGLHGSLAPHAPYSTSKELIALISEYNISSNLPGSIHNQESEEETKFFMGQKSGFGDLYEFLKLDLSWFKAPKTTSLKYYIDSIKSQQTLLVHNTFTNKEEVEIANTKNIIWCFCPNANIYIENKIPDFDLFINKKKNICLGTDSLASNHQLSLVHEANILLQNSQIEFVEVLKSMTSNPSELLNIGDHFGKIDIGKNSGLNLIEYKNNQIHFIKKIA
jgi:cytosine/adenosine deaminase-related metal-dependent hydrolase